MRVGVLEVPDRRISATGLLSDRKLTFLMPTLDPKCRPPLQKGKVLGIRLTGRSMLGAMSQQFHCWKIIATTLGQGRTHGCEGLDGHRYGRPRQINYAAHHNYWTCLDCVGNRQASSTKSVIVF